MRLPSWPLFGLFFATAIMIEGNLQADDLQQKFLPSGMTKRVGGYRPIRAEMNKDSDIVKIVPDGLESPKFGAIVIGDKSWVFIVDEPDDKPATLFIDTNGDGDLTNDPKAKWEARNENGSTIYSGDGQIDLGDGKLGSLGLYRFDPKDERRAQLKNTLMFYIDYGFEFTFQLDAKEFSTFVAGNPSDNERLPVDRDGNGKISQNLEMATLGKPFNFTGSTYILALNAGKLSLERATTELPQMQLPPDLTLGKRALPFTGTTMDGTEIEFPKHYAGKIVMLDFWATWCGPCIAEVPNMKKAYADWHEEGFEILGISFDRADAEDKIKEFEEKHELTWSQIYEGKFWETTIGKMHDVSGIPFVLLVDGDTGEILATARELRGPGLSTIIGQRLLKKKSGAAVDTP